MTRDKLTLTLLDGGQTGDIEYSFDVVRGVDNSQRKDAFSIAPPGQPASGNIFLGVSGQQADRRVTFAAHNDGTDWSNGTAADTDFFSSTVETLAEQRRWLEDYIHAPDFSASWTLDHDNGNEYDAQEVFFENVDFPALQQDSPKWVEVRLDLRRGSSV